MPTAGSGGGEAQKLAAMTTSEADKRLTPEQCHQRAEKCRRLAKMAEVERHQIMLNHMAETWERLATEMRRQH
jgi:hypothetical protein